MKIYHFAIIFVIFAISVVIIKETELKEKVFEEREAVLNRRIIGKAVEAAAGELRAAGVSFETATAQKAIDAFYYSLYASMGIMDNAHQREAVKEGFSSFTIFLNEGYYVYDCIPDESGGMEKRVYKGSELLPYDEDLTGHIGFLCSYKEQIFSSASVIQGSIYVVDSDMLYHEEGCLYIGQEEHKVFSKDGCAMLGAHPCSKCIYR